VGRVRLFIGLCSCAVALTLATRETPAGAVVAKIGGHGYGITPITGADQASLVGAYRAQGSVALTGSRVRNFDEPPHGGSLLNSEGGPVMHSVTTHVIYWDPPTSQFTATTKAIVSNFFTDVAHDSGLASNVFAVAGQYTDSSGHAAYSSSFAGALVDSHAYPTSENCLPPTGVDEGPYSNCLFDKQLQEELSAFIAEKGLPRGPTQLYFVLLPHNVATCLPEVVEGKQVCSNDFYCAYHSYINPGTANEIIYADIPFSLLDTSFAKGCQSDGNSIIQLPNGDVGASNTETRFADVAVKYMSHEYIEAVTDPLVNFSTAWVDEKGLEIGDKCNGVPFEPAEEGEPGFDKHAFTPTLGGSAGSGTLFNQTIDTGHYYLQSEWDNAAVACLMKPLALSAAGFTPTSAPAIVGSAVNFNGSAADPYGKLGLTWKWGDGTEESKGATPSHTYAAGGTYEVTMTPKDELTGATTAPVLHTLVVDKISQTIAITSNAPGSATVGGPAYSVEASATSGLAAAFTIDASSSSVCSVSGTTVSFTGAGTCTIEANQEGNTAYAPASQAQQSFTVSPAPTPILPILTTEVTPPAPNSEFSAGAAAFNPTTGAITLTESVSESGTFSWLLTFQNGKFGVFVAKKAKCKKGQVKLNVKCRPSAIVFAKGSQIVAAPGTVTFTVKPSASGLKALRSAFKRKRGLPVTATLTFQSSRGGSPVSHTQSVIVKLRGHKK